MPRLVIREHPRLPRVSAPYSQVVRAGNLVFLSGAVGRAPDGTIARGDVQAQFRQLLDNTEAALQLAGARREHVVRVTLYLIDMRHKPLLDRMREEFFGQQWPAATAVGVTALASPDYLVEMDSIAVVD